MNEKLLAPYRECKSSSRQGRSHQSLPPHQLIRTRILVVVLHPDRNRMLARRGIQPQTIVRLLCVPPHFELPAIAE